MLKNSECQAYRVDTILGQCVYEEHSDHDKSLILEKITPENLEDDTKEVLEEESDMASNVEDWGYAKSFQEAEEIVDLRSYGNAPTDMMADGAGGEVAHKQLEEEIQLENSQKHIFRRYKACIKPIP